jgi:hypothetical protein
MTKIITCNELRYRTLDEARGSVPDASDQIRPHRARFAGAHHCAGQPRKRPPRHGGGTPTAAVLERGTERIFVEDSRSARC